MCQKELDKINFKTNKRRLDGLQSQCINCHKEYRRQHYLKNREKYIKLAADGGDNFRTWWAEYRKQFVCSCGESHPGCIDFHHPNDNKSANVSKLVIDKCKTKLLTEIEKCIPLCANCHRKHHWNERN
jgi:hypothetical protein